MHFRILPTLLLTASGGMAVCQAPPEMVHLYDRSTALVTARDSVRMAQFVDSLCAAAKDREGQVICDLFTARWHRHNGRQLEAHRMFDSISAHATGIHPYLEWLLHYQHAKLLNSMQLYELARNEALLARNAAMACKMPDEALEMDLLLAEIDLDDGNYEQALSSFASLLERSKASRHIEGICRALIGIGNTHYYQEQDQEALKYYRKALEIAQAGQDQDLILSAVFNIGATLGYTEGPEKAIALNRSLLDTAGPSFHPRTKADLLTNTASWYSDLGNDRQALSAIDEALHIYGTINDTVS
ncbi:MAG: tetratricopeptide repeat protein, partial [Flavobacteriales bacterium]